jgi:tetratricopeptide (TPR) repeat protein
MAALPQVTTGEVAPDAKRLDYPASDSTLRQDLIAALRDITPDKANERVALLRQLSVIERDRGRIDVAQRLIDDALNQAIQQSLRLEIARCRLERAASLAQSGALDEADAELSRIDPHDLHGQQARLFGQRAVVLLMQDRFREAELCFEDALASAVREHDDLTTASVFANRGVHRAAVGALLDAEADFRSARHAYRALDQVQRELECAHDLGLVLARQGRIAEALREMISADEEMRTRQIFSPDVSADRSEVFIQAGLFREAAVAAEEAQALAASTGAHRVAPEISLLAARAACGVGDLRRARRAAEEAINGFATLRREAQLATAQAVLALVSEPSAESLDDVLEHGDPIVCSEIAIAVLRHAPDAESGPWTLDPETDGAISRYLAAQVGSESSVVRLRSQWARARIQLAHDDLAGAAADLDELLEELHRHVRSIASAELVDASVDAVVPMEESLTTLALRTNDAGAARGRAVRLRSIRSAALLNRASNSATLGLRDEHRIVSAKITAAEGNADDLLSLLRRRGELEQQLRAADWTSARVSGPRTGSLSDEVGQSPTLTVDSAIPIGTQVAFVTGYSQLVALVSGPDDDRIVELGATKDIDAAIAALRSAVAALLASESDEHVMRLGSIERAAARVERLVLPEMQRGCVTIEPNATVAGVPWAMLPRLRGTTLRVRTGVEQRADLTRFAGRRAFVGDQRGGQTVVIVGPHLPFGRQEAELIRKAVKGSVVIDSEAATAAAVLSAANDPATKVLHLIAHGTVRADRPLFGALEFHDGIITPEDIELIDRSPPVVVLSSCDLGGSRVLSPSMGFAGRLHARGTTAVVGACIPTSDEHSPELMAALHQSMAAGIDVPTALATAQSQTRSEIARWAGHAFTAYVPLGA